MFVSSDTLYIQIYIYISKQQYNIVYFGMYLRIHKQPYMVTMSHSRGVALHEAPCWRGTLRFARTLHELDDAHDDDDDDDGDDHHGQP